MADSVGLGKTYTALAVIKFFELRNERVLVLCPKKLHFNDILTNFAPRARGRSDEVSDTIDLVIATDCISEGQNLQDCDTVLNYDIHWNPVRIIQRFGRIDRIGSNNVAVKMINYWPTEDMEVYLRLRNRVESRMALADATASGDDDPLNESTYEYAQMELNFRDKQLERLRKSNSRLFSISFDVIPHLWYNFFTCVITFYFLMNAKSQLRAVFFRTDRGNEPVREWLEGLGERDERIIDADITIVTEHWPLVLT